MSTSFGVYTSILEAFQKGYKIIVVEDVTADRDKEVHDLVMSKVLPQIALVMKTEEKIGELK